jgi:hypothetical protein
MDVEAVRAVIARAAERSGRDPGDVTIVAVTKGHPLDRAREAATAGLLDLGENRVQEALGKQEAWQDPPADLRWHLIGHLQRNKARQAVGRFALIHSLDSVRLADALEQAAAAAGVTQRVLVEVNVAGEAQKSGAPLADAAAILRHAAALPHLAVEGLMTMAPLTSDQQVLRRTFRGLRELRDTLFAHGAVSSRRSPHLSMGMSNDFAIAVEEGATMVRLGTILFGERGRVQA